MYIIEKSDEFDKWLRKLKDYKPDSEFRQNEKPGNLSTYQRKILPLVIQSSGAQE